jgi:hypothetical protein
VTEHLSAFQKSDGAKNTVVGVSAGAESFGVGTSALERAWSPCCEIADQSEVRTAPLAVHERADSDDLADVLNRYTNAEVVRRDARILGKVGHHQTGAERGVERSIDQITRANEVNAVGQRLFIHEVIAKGDDLPVMNGHGERLHEHVARRVGRDPSPSNL